MKLIITAIVLAFCLVSLTAQEDKGAKESPKEASKEAAKEAPDEESKEHDHAAHVDEGKGFVNTNANKIIFTNSLQKASYVMGLQAGSSVMMQGEELVVVEMAIAGFTDVLKERMPAVSPFEAEDTLKEFEREFRLYQEKKAQRDAEENKLKGAAFLSENKKKEGVVTTSSGLQYKLVSPGKGESPKEDDRVQIHFRSRMIDGTEFGNSYRHARPPVATVKSLPKGLQEALLQMKPGEKRELFVPSELAYGSREVGKGVGPHSTIIFDLELVGIEKEETQEARK